MPVAPPGERDAEPGNFGPRHDSLVNYEEAPPAPPEAPPTNAQGAGEPASRAMSAEILALETGLARAQWSRVENRDPVKRYNPVEEAKLGELAPGYDWKRYLVAADIEAVIEHVERAVFERTGVRLAREVRIVGAPR